MQLDAIRCATIVRILKKKTEGKKYVKLLLEGVLACRERFKPKEMARIMVGDSNSLIKQHMSQIEDVFGSGKEKPLGFWHSIIRQVYVKQLLTKEIESYGILKITDSGKEYIKNPYSFEITEDHDYDSLNSGSGSNQKGIAMDKILFNILKDLRKKVAKEIGLPPAILFMEPSLIDMANQYPITLEEMAQVQGVGQGKAKKYGQDFINAIRKYVDENNIERPQDIVVRTVANKKSNKIYIIQSLDKKLWIDDIAKGKGISHEELLTEMEEIVETGTRLNLGHIILDMMEEDEREDIHEFFKETEDFSFDEARVEFEEDEFTDDEIRLLRIDFISKVAN